MAWQQVCYGFASDAFDGTLSGIQLAMLNIHKCKANNAVFVITAKSSKSIRLVATAITVDIFISAVDLLNEPLHG